MIRCHECDSKITNVDTFCPFCGIALAQSQTDENNEDKIKDDSLETGASLIDALISGDPENSEEVESESELDDSSDDEIDMSETIVITPQKKVESDETKSEEFIDISTLNDEESEKEEPLSETIEDAIEESVEEVTPSDVEPVRITSDKTDDVDAIEEKVEEATSSDAESGETISDKTDDEGDNEPDLTEEESKDSQQEITSVEEATSASEAENSLSTKTEDYAKEDFLEDNTILMNREDLKGEQKYDDLIDRASGNATPAKETEIANSNLEVAEEKNDDVEVPKNESDNQEAEEPETSISVDSEVNDTDVEVESDGELENLESGEIDSVLSDIAEKSREDIENTKESASDVVENDENQETLNEQEPVEKSEDVKEESPEDVDATSKNNDEPEVSAAGIAPDEELSEEIKSSESAQLEQDASETDSEVNKKEEVKTEKPKDQPPVRTQTTPNIGVEDTDGSNKTKLKPLDEGTVLNDRYEIVRKIGGGGMGAVYLANDRNLGGVLRAVKEMVQSYIEEEQQEKAIKDFKRESMLLTSLEHSSIPTIYDYFYDEKEARFYLVMKYISGGDLSGKLRAAPEGRLDEKDVVEWGMQVADVLDYLHNHEPPIVYRDLKPANVMVDSKSGRVMLIDFGIARWVNKEEKGVTAVGTMGYAPPELFSGNVEPRSDIYSLGSTMFHLLTGADPQSNPLLIFDFQKNPRPRQINPSLSDQIEQILMRCVEYSADGRFNSAGEMRDALRQHLERLQIGNVSYGVKETPKAIGLSDQPVFCGFCGQKIVATDMFCAFCGAKQPLAQSGVQSQEYISVHTTAKLIVDGTSELDVPAFSLEKEDNLVGRRDPMSNIFPEIDLSKFDPHTKISRRHARIWRDGNNYLVEDMGSSNGTMVIASVSDMVKLAPHESRVLNNGDKIKLGDTTLNFVVG